MGIYASDIETTGLLHQMMKQENPKLHNLCSLDVSSSEMKLFEGTQREEIQDWLNQGHTFIMHYGSLFDFEALKLLGYDVSKTKLIDSVALSWYLEPNRVVHGLEQYGVEFGVPKPPIADWENLSQEEYNNRVIEDCKIQKKLWHKQVQRLQTLYGEDEGSFDRIINFLMQKMEELRQQQENKWKLDVPAAEKLEKKLAAEIAEKTDALRLVMPKNPIYAVRKRPAKPFKKDGTLSATGERWKALTERLGLSFEYKEDIKEVVEYEEGNPASHTQMKAWLDSLGWEPMTFKFVKGEPGKNEDRNIPQINLKGGEICDSVKELIAKEPGIEHIAGLGILNHRYGVVKGFLRDAIDGELIAGAAGFTNTLRLQHREIVNLPSLRVKYGAELRGLLVARPGKKLLGSDLSSLEDRLKHHFQWSLDKAYVQSQMASDFDPHLLIASIAGLLDDDEVNFYKWMKAKCPDEYGVPLTYYRNLSEDERKKEFKRIDEVRAVGKSTNYACQYGAGVATIARTAKCSTAIAKKLHNAYHKMNWSIAKIASLMKVKKTSFGEWQWNPISKYWYSLRSEKDRFSTLIQGSGSYVLDLWLYHCERLAKRRGLEWKLVGQMHDELIEEFDEELEDEHRQLVADGLQCVNDALKLNRELACGIDFGRRYSEIH
jgi:hypothetical protein